MYLDPTIVSWLLIGGASFCSFMIGRTFNSLSRDEIIENTIVWMIDNNFVKAHKNIDGEWELEDLDGQK